MKNKEQVIENILKSLYELSVLLETENLFLTYKNKKWCLYKNNMLKQNSLCESSSIENLIKMIKDKQTKNTEI